MRVFGSFRAVSDSAEAATFHTRRAAELIAFLAMQPSQRARRSVIGTELWPETERQDQLRNLRTALHYARASIGSDSILVREEGEESILTLVANTDWNRAHQLELRLAGEVDPNERFVLLFSLNEMLRQPVLDSWTQDWVEPYRARQTLFQTRVVVSLAEELAAKGEISLALGHIQEQAIRTPFDESVVHLQLRLLGQLNRENEAQRVYVDYRERLKNEMGLEVSRELRALAGRVAAGAYANSQISIVPSFQLELVQNLLTLLAKDSPERLLPLFAAPEVNWAVVTNGPELRGILESVMDRTSGWDPDRAGVAKRLLQAYIQDGEFQKIRVLARSLVDSERPSDKIAAWNYLAEVATFDGEHEVGIKCLSEALRCAEEAGLPYLVAVTQSNLGTLHLGFGNYDLAVEKMANSIDLLGSRDEPNARFSLARVISLVAMAEAMRGQSNAAQAMAERWILLTEQDEAMRQDAVGLSIIALIKAGNQDSDAVSWSLRALQCALQGRRKLDTVLTSLNVCASVSLLGSKALAKGAAERLLPWLAEFRTIILPVERHLLGVSGLEMSQMGLDLESLPKIVVDLREAILDAYPKARV